MAKQRYSTKRIISELVATQGLVSLAAENLGCTPMTIYNRAKAEPEIQQAIDNSRDNLLDRAELALRAAVIDREPWAVSLVLKTLGRGRGYGEVVRNEHAGAPGGPPIEVIHVKPGDPSA